MVQLWIFSLDSFELSKARCLSTDFYWVFDPNIIFLDTRNGGSNTLKRFFKGTSPPMLGPYFRCRIPQLILLNGLQISRSIGRNLLLVQMIRWLKRPIQNIKSLPTAFELIINSKRLNSCIDESNIRLLITSQPWLRSILNRRVVKHNLIVIT